MTDKPDQASENSKGRVTAWPITYRPSEHARITVSGGWAPMFDATIEPSAVKHIAKLGDLPDHQLQALEECLTDVLADHAMCEADRDKKTGRHFTRRQLLNELSKLTRLKDGDNPPCIPPWLVDEIERTEYQRLVEAELGPLPQRVIGSPEEFSHALSITRRASVLACQRVQASLNDARALRDIAVDAHAYVSARSETTQEYFATKRALDMGMRRVAELMLHFWTRRLSRPAEISDTLIAFTEAVYILCGIKKKDDARNYDTVKKALYSARKGLSIWPTG